MREKATLVPFLLIEVDAARREDREYVDTAFAAPSGGKHYYQALENFAPRIVMDRLTAGLVAFPVIQYWPSYDLLQHFYADCDQSDLVVLLRAKLLQDFGQATLLTDSDPQAAFVLAENAGWLCLSLLKMNDKDLEAQRTALKIRSFLQGNTAAWNQSALHDLLQ